LTCLILFEALDKWEIENVIYECTVGLQSTFLYDKM
jgi:hypothetical protein